MYSVHRYVCNFLDININVKLRKIAPNQSSGKQNFTIPDSILVLGMYRVGQKQLDDLNLAPCRHLCRWRSETHIVG